MKVAKSKNIRIENRRAKFDFDWIETYTAGIQLRGTEIKSLRAGHAQITESFCQFSNNELFIVNMNIDPYQFGNIWNHSTKRTRKLLLSKKELKKLEKKSTNTGLTIVPLKLFINDRGLAKLSICLARGRKNYDKRQALRKEDLKRDLHRITKNH